MSQNGQTHFIITAAFAVNVSDHVGTLCIKGLMHLLWQDQKL